MIEIINIVKNIIEENGISSLINSYILDSGVYVKVNKEPVTVNDLYVVNKNTDISSTISVYNWFRKRAFYEGVLNTDTNKCLLQKGELWKRVHSVTPYAIFFKYETINKFHSVEVIEEHFYKVSTLSDRSIDIKSISSMFYNKILEVKEAIEEKGLKLSQKDRILIFCDVSPSLYEQAYNDYIKKYGFGKTHEPVEVNGELYGLPCLGMGLDSKKIILNSNDIREVPYRISYSDNIILSYISKLRKNISEIVSNYKNSEVLYDIQFHISEIVYINKNIHTERKKTFNKYSVLSKNTAESIKSMKSHGEVLEIIEKSLTNWTISPAINRFYSNSDDMSNYFKNYSKKISNHSLLQQIIGDRDCLKHYFNGNDDIDISRSLERVLKGFYEYDSNKVNDDNGIPFALLKFKLDAMLSVMDYVSGKEKYKHMAIQLNDMLNKFIQDKQNGKVNISNDAEFYFLSGQLIRFLAYQSEQKNKKSNLMGNFMIHSRDKIKDHIINMYDLYSYKIQLFSESYVNLVYQQVIAYGIGMSEDKDKDNWYYYQAGLVGKNVLFSKKEIEEAKKEDLEALESTTNE